jgi:glycosyltransferase involved in cell wall biosynthesis
MSLTYGLLSTFPPTACGLATFTAALAAQLDASTDHGDDCIVVRAVTSAGFAPPGVAVELIAGSEASRLGTVAALNSADVVIVQHEYGIFGGRDGDEIVAVLEPLVAPVIVVLHTVLVDPTVHQREVLERVMATADAVVTMTQTARRRLEVGYAVDMRKVSVIPHGAHVPPCLNTDVSGGGRPVVLTWGLIGPGKGIEWGIEALAQLRDLHPYPRYLIVGKTHPKVLAAHGEAYRASLVALADRLGLSEDVDFDATYYDVPALQRVVGQATVVLLPYDSPDQITSGVLIDAVAAGKPVISTRFPHAVELLGGGVGLLVGHRNPTEIAAALRRVLGDATLRNAMRDASARLAPSLAWPAVAASYRTLADEVVEARAAAVA